MAAALECRPSLVVTSDTGLSGGGWADGCIGRNRRRVVIKIIYRYDRFYSNPVKVTKW